MSVSHAVMAWPWLAVALFLATPSLALRQQESANGRLAASTWTDRASGARRAAQLELARARGQRSSGVPDKAHTQLPAQGGKFAVLISGLRSRLVLNSTLEQVVRPAARLGYQVDVYLSLVDKGDGMAFTSHGLSDPELEGKPRDEFRRLLEGAVAMAGGRLVHYAQRDVQEVVDPLPSNSSPREVMWEYPPSESAFGLNVLRRWKSSEELLNETLRSGTDYDFLLWEREDQYWVKPLWLFNFRSGAEGSKSVYAKNCLGWGGINDKALLLGRDAARKLMTAYSSFWASDGRPHSRNAEQYLNALAGVRGLAVRKVPFAVLPSADATFAKQGRSKLPSLCIKEFYSCSSELPKGSPPFCPVMK